MNTNMIILEKEKGRHLETNAVEKEKFQSQIDNLIIQNEEAEKIIHNTQNENNSLHEKLNRNQDEILLMEKQIQNLREENKNLKVEANSKIYDCNKEIENVRIRYENDQEELLMVKNKKEYYIYIYIYIIYYFYYTEY